MPLAQTPTKIITDPRGYLTAVHGTVGVGKTSFGKQIDGHYFLQTEVGTAGVQVFGDPIFNWHDFIDKGRELVEAKKSGFKDQREIKTIVIDVLEKLFWYAGAEVCATQTFLEKGVPKKYKTIEEPQYGRGYKAAYQLLLKNLEALCLHGFGMLLLSHTKERIVKWGGEDLTHQGFDLPPSACNAIEAACDAIGCFVVEQEIVKSEEGIVTTIEHGRYQYWQQTFLRTAKHRLEGFPEKLPLPMGRGWEVYCEAFAETLAKKKEHE